MFQNSFDRVVGTDSPAFRSFGQNSIDLFRREKPERVVARRTGPTICHGIKHRVEFSRRTGCLGEFSTPVNHSCFSEACFPEAARYGDWPQSSSWPQPSISSTGSPFFSVRKSGQRGKARYCREGREYGEISFLWSEHRPARERNSESPPELPRCHTQACRSSS